MDIRVSYNWVKEYVDTKLKPEELARELSLHAVNVERISAEGENLENIVVGQIKKIRPHAKADKLKLADVDIGQAKTLQVVCGGTNIYEGMKVAMALPGAKVRWHGQGDLVELKTAKIRDEESQGMICAPAEIGLGLMYHEYVGAMVLDLPKDLKVGMPLAKALDLTDAVYDIEVTSNRPDALGVIGLAREAAAVSGGKFLYQMPREIKASGAKLPIAIELKARDLCYRYNGLVISGVKIGPSPWWLEKRLRQVGLRSINNVVDITNYVLLEHGQPLHAFDYDKLAGNKIIVRKAKSGEKLKALDGNEYKLKDDNLVIADAQKAVAIAGIMGGEETGVVNGTTNILLESANFDAVSVRRTARQLQLHSDSSARFEKYLNTESTGPAIWRAAHLILQLAGGQVASSLQDVRSKKYTPRKIYFNPGQVTDVVGVEIKPAKIKSYLSALGFKVAGEKKIQVTVPPWRHEDVRHDYDLVEEVARLYGYHNIPSHLPSGRLADDVLDKNLVWEDRLRVIMSELGLTEIYSYSFISEKMLISVGLDPKTCLKLYNPLNEDMVYMRSTLLPSLLQVLAENEGHVSDQAIFELSNIYIAKGLEDLPQERAQLVGAITGKDWRETFYKAKGILEHVFVKMGIKPERLIWRPPADKVWDLSRSGTAFTFDGVDLGTIGVIKSDILQKFGVKSALIAWQFDVKNLIGEASEIKKYRPIAKFPSVRLDLALLVRRDLEWQSIADLVKSEGGKHVESVEVFDVYQGKGVPLDMKSIAFHIRYRAKNRTLEMNEVQAMQTKIIKLLEKKLKAKVRL